MATEKTDDYGGKSQSDRMIDRAIAALAERQHGVVASWQLTRELGLGDDAIRYRVSIGRLHRIHRGVYAVGHRKLTRQGHRMAAVLAYGPRRSAQPPLGGRALGHRPGLVQDRRDDPARQAQPQDDPRPHSKARRPRTATVRDGIPVTSVERTILDLAARLSKDSLTHLIEEADRRAPVRPPETRPRDRAPAPRPPASLA